MAQTNGIGSFEQDHHRTLRETVRKFAEKEVSPRAAEIDSSDSFPRDLYQRLGQLGFLGMTAPEEYGGEGADELSMTIVIEELARVSGTVANSCLLAKLQAEFICRLGSDEQKARYVPRITSGELICLISVTEPDTGSDVAAVSTRARQVDGGWLLTGTKAFMTLGTEGGLSITLARTPATEEGKDDAFTLFLHERSEDGDLSRGFMPLHKESLMGMRGLGTAGIVMEDTFVPDDAVLGEVGRGLTGALRSFTNGRIVIASLALGLGVGAFEQAMNYVGERSAFGQPIGEFQGVQFMLADANVGIDAARLLIQRAALAKDEGRDYTQEASMAKLFASDMANRVATDAVQIHGGFGYTKDAVVERIFRDAKLTQIYEGTNQIQRVIIARGLMKKKSA